MDITARQLAQVLQDKYLHVPVVVENKKGAGGLVALNHVLSQPSDGYTLFGLTSSVISKAVQARQHARLDGLHYLARLVTDYECLITSSGSEISDFETLVQSGRANPGSQIWAGPAAGGTDHIFAQKVWNKLGISAKWIPYRSGGEALAAILGKHAHVYVGNPQDVVGRSDLRIAAVAAPNRLSHFKDAPTFEELGYPELTGEMLWRGFAVRKGVEEARVEFLESVLSRAIKDPQWIKFIESANVQSTFDTAENFEQIVRQQIVSDREFFHSNG
ncbi:MAG: tripartite tricarboxylate transporter substrate binding protein, partial [Bdellovibrionales bacterium]|nr:tripartite tricarboxylate transporter substrate binding protein [Bdellovibrionales bacterium]